MNSKRGTIKGLSIALVVLGAIGVLSCLYIIFGVNVNASSAATYNTAIDRVMSIDPTYTYADAEMIVSSVIAFFNFAGVWGLIVSTLTLIAGIFGVKSSKDVASTKNLGRVAFGVFVATAIVNGISLSILCCVLAIIAAVKCNAENKLVAAAEIKSNMKPTQPACGSKPIVELIENGQHT